MISAPRIRTEPGQEDLLCRLRFLGRAGGRHLIDMQLDVEQQCGVGGMTPPAPRAPVTGVGESPAGGDRRPAFRPRPLSQPPITSLNRRPT